MKRNDFKKIIKIRSQWQFTGDNYKLPSGEPISVYVRKKPVILGKQTEIIA